MSTNLAGGVCIGELKAAIFRAARLSANCTPLGGVNGGLVTAGLVTMTADPIVKEGVSLEQENGAGDLLFSYESDDKLKGYTISGEMGFADFEMMALLFGGSVILGKAGGDYAGTVIGYADPNYTAPARYGTYLEVITLAVEEGAGDCVASDGGAPVAIGNIFGKAKLRSGSISFGNDIQRVSFTGKSVTNPNLFNGPWNDYPGAGYIPNTPRAKVGYTQAEYDAILATVQCGYVDLPTGS